MQLYFVLLAKINVFVLNVYYDMIIRHMKFKMLLVV